MATVITNQLHDLRIRLQSSQLGQFLRWWVGELRALLPPALRERMQYASRRLILQVSEVDIAVSVLESDKLQALDVFPLDQSVQVQQTRFRDLLEERELAEVARDLLIPEDDVLRKEVMMPVAAEVNLRQALAYEMDRQTPFSADGVYFDYRIIGRNRDTGQLKVELLVAPRAPLDKCVEILAARGMAPNTADVMIDDLPAGLNLLPVEKRVGMINRRARANFSLAGAVVVLLALVMTQSLWLRTHQLEEVQQAIDEVREEALRVQQVREQIQDASEAAGFMINQRAEAVPTVKVLAEVTRIVPDNTFLDRLLISKDSVQLQGKSDNAQQLIELINQSSMFSDAAFRGPTRLDTRSQKEIFDLTAKTSTGEQE